MIAGLITNPVDVIKTRMMTNTVKEEYYLTPICWLRKLIREEGYLALFKGLPVRLVYLTLGGIAYFYCYNFALKALKADARYHQTRTRKKQP